MNKPYISYHDNGQIREEGCYKDEKKVGKWIRYYENGNIEEERNYKNGLLDGKLIYHWKNGDRRGEYTFKNGRPTSLGATWYDKNGNKEPPIRFS